MDKKTVAQTLGVSEKSVSRYAASGKLPSRYIQGKNGKQLDFDESEVEKFKDELALPTERAFVKPAQGKGAQPNPDAGTALATLPDSNAAALTFLAQLQSLGHLSQPNSRTAENGAALGPKLLLSLDEASALTGLSTARLRAAIGEEKLVARKVGRAWKMRRGDVERFIDSIFGAQ